MMMLLSNMTMESEAPSSYFTDSKPTIQRFFLHGIGLEEVAAIKDGFVFSTTSSQGMVEITEVSDFAGKDIEVKKLVDANSRKAMEKANSIGGPSSVVDTVLEQIKKKQKLSVLDKTKKDWGEFEDENKGVEEDLDAYKKSSNHYLGKVSFFERADYQEFERERDVRLSLQSKRRSYV